MFLARWASWLAPTTKTIDQQKILNTCNDVDPDLSWIQTMASIGDSYAAGLGAGQRVDFSCSRYDTAYPTIVHEFLKTAPRSNVTHQSLACSGADTTEISAKQIPLLDTNLNLITISAGGNDIGLTPILSDCVYQFYMAGEEACQKSIAEAQAKIANDTQLYHNVTTLIEAAKPHLNATHGLIYVTGYAHFFATDDTTCDTVTWAVWRTLTQHKQYLTLSMRAALNDLVLSVNVVLRRAVRAAGPNVHFIDYDSSVAQLRGRYCEAGIHEPDPNRRGLMFYEWDTVDGGENRTGLQNSTGEGVPRGSFEGGIAEQINRTLSEHPDWSFDPDKGFVEKNKTDVDGRGMVEDTIHWLIPDSYKRVFHMRTHGHWIVARMIWDDVRRYSLSQTIAREVEEL